MVPTIPHPPFPLYRLPRGPAAWLLEAPFSPGIGGRGGRFDKPAESIENRAGNPSDPTDRPAATDAAAVGEAARRMMPRQKGVGAHGPEPLPVTRVAPERPAP